MKILKDMPPETMVALDDGRIYYVEGWIEWDVIPPETLDYRTETGNSAAISRIGGESEISKFYPKRIVEADADGRAFGPEVLFYRLDSEFKSKLIEALQQTDFSSAEQLLWDEYSF